MVHAEALLALLQAGASCTTGLFNWGNPRGHASCALTGRHAVDGFSLTNPYKPACNFSPGILKTSNRSSALAHPQFYEVLQYFRLSGLGRIPNRGPSPAPFRNFFDILSITILQRLGPGHSFRLARSVHLLTANSARVWVIEYRWSLKDLHCKRALGRCFLWHVG